MKNPGEDMQNLGTLGGSSSYAYGINNFGQVVGQAADGNYDRAFLWERGVMYNLNDLTVNPPADPYRWLYEARAINDRGWIVGNDSLGGAFLLTPVTGSVPLGLLLD